MCSPTLPGHHDRGEYIPQVRFRACFEGAEWMRGPFSPPYSYLVMMPPKNRINLAYFGVASC